MHQLVDALTDDFLLCDPGYVDMFFKDVLLCKISTNKNNSNHIEIPESVSKCSNSNS